MRRAFGLAVFAGLVLVGASCTPFITPGGEAPLRYRDDVFANVTVQSNLAYGSAPNELGEPVTLLLDAYEPTDDTATARPAIVWVHGGSFRGGSKTSPEIVSEAQTFARKGYFNVSINYRLSPSGCSFGGVTLSCLWAIGAAQTDAQAAVRWLRANAATYRIDPDRIAVAGTSAGAITALNVAYNSENPGTSGNPGFSSDVGAAVSLSGALIFGNVLATDPPSLSFHGTNDFVVPYQQALTTADRIRAGGATHYLTTFDGAGHVPFVQYVSTIIEQTRNFLYHELDLAHADQ